MGFRALVGNRVRLRAVGGDDPGVVEAWYDEATSAAYEERTIEELQASTLLAIVRPEEDEPIGLLEYETTGGWLAVRLIALAKAYRGWGYGSDAVRALEEWALREGIAERFRAEVDARNGLGLYFWLRLGYRPASPGELDWMSDRPRDMMPMIRTAA